MYICEILLHLAVIVFPNTNIGNELVLDINKYTINENKINMEVVGVIKMIDQTKEVGTGGFKKRDIVVTTDEQFPQHILVQFVQDKCDLLNGFQVGESVKISLNLRGREWQNPKGEIVYFNTIQGWRIDKNDSYQNGNQPQSAEKAYNNKPQANTPNSFVDEEPDDLPF